MSTSCGNPETEKDAVMQRELPHCIHMSHNKQFRRSPKIRQGERVYKMQNEDRKRRYPLRSILQVRKPNRRRNALNCFIGSVFSQ